MSCILHIETATSLCSVALSQDGVCLYEEVDEQGMTAARQLASFADRALSFADSHAIPVDAVAVSKGPGSYTGLRIGVSLAKGVAYARGIKLIGIPTLKILTVPTLLGQDDMDENAWLCPMIDARRMEVYCALYNRALREERPTQALVVDQESFSDVLAERAVYFLGNGADKCAGVINHPRATFIPHVVPKAKSMIPLAEMAMARGVFEDVAYFEPFYLKDFVATTPKARL